MVEEPSVSNMAKITGSSSIPEIRIKDEPADTGYETSNAVGIQISGTTSTTPSAYAALPNIPTPISIALNHTSGLTTTTTTSRSLPKLPAGVTVSPSASLPDGSNPVRAVDNKGKTFFIIQPKTVASGSVAKAPVTLQWSKMPAPQVSKLKTVTGIPQPTRIVTQNKKDNQYAVILANKPTPAPLPAQRNTQMQPTPLVIEPRDDDDLPVLSSTTNQVNTLSSLVMTTEIKDHTSNVNAQTVVSGDGQNRTVCGMVFNKGTSRWARKEYLCNFCKFSETTYESFNAHLAAHVFSCNHCKYKAFTRFQVLKHRQDSHPQFNHELIGYEGLDKLCADANVASAKTAGSTAKSSSQNVRLDRASNSIAMTHLPGKGAAGATPFSAPTTNTSIMVTTTATKPAAVVQATYTAPAIIRQGAGFSPKSTTVITPVTPDQRSGKPAPFASMPKVSPPALRSLLANPSSTGTSSTPHSSTTKLWKCYYCEKRSEVQAELVSHIKQHHPNMPFKLQSISRVVKGHKTPPRDPTDHDEAQEQDSKQYLWVCYYCDATNTDRNSIIAHVKTKHKNSKIVIRRKRIPDEVAADEGPPLLERFDSEHGKDGVPTPADQQETAQSKPGGSSPRVPTLEREEDNPVTVKTETPVSDTDTASEKESATPDLKKDESDSSQLETDSSESKVKIIYKLRMNADLMTIDRANQQAQCLKCGKVMYGKRAVAHMREHTYIHSNHYPWECGHCMLKCRRRNLVLQHLLWQHPGQPLTIIHYTTNAKLCGVSLMEKTEPSKPVASMVKTQLKPAKTKMLGPRRVREAHIRKHATHMWKCPYCSRLSVHKGQILLHIKFVHPNKRITVDPWKISRPTSHADVINKQRRASIKLVRMEDMGKYDHLKTVLETGGASLVHDMDQDDNEILPRFLPVKSSSRTGHPRPRPWEKGYTCCMCSKPLSTLFSAKKHLSLRNAKHVSRVCAVYSRDYKRSKYVLYLCPAAQCQFSSERQVLMDQHFADFPDHYPELAVHKDTPSQNKQLLDTDNPLDEHKMSGQDVVPDTGSPAAAAKDPSPIFGADFGALPSVGIDFYASLSADDPDIDQDMPPSAKVGKLKCFYCEFPTTHDIDEMKDHLRQEHPDDEPRVANASKDHQGIRAYFLCPEDHCDYITVPERNFVLHISKTHPDMESVLPLTRRYLVKYKNRRQRHNRKRDSDDERDVDFDPRRPNFHPDFQKLTKKSGARRRSRSKKSVQLVEPEASESTSQLFPGRFKCFMCGDQFNLHCEIKEHVLKEHSDKPCVCIDLVAKSKRKRSTCRFCPLENCEFFTTKDAAAVDQHLQSVHKHYMHYIKPERPAKPLSHKVHVPEQSKVPSDAIHVVQTTPNTYKIKINLTKGKVHRIEANSDATEEMPPAAETKKDSPQPISEADESEPAGADSSESEDDKPLRHFTQTSEPKEPSGDDAGVKGEGDGEGVTQKDFQEIGEELNRLNQDLEKWLNTGKPAAKQFDVQAEISEYLAEEDKSLTGQEAEEMNAHSESTVQEGEEGGGKGKEENEEDDGESEEEESEKEAEESGKEDPDSEKDESESEKEDPESEEDHDSEKEHQESEKGDGEADHDEKGEEEEEEEEEEEDADDIQLISTTTEGEEHEQTASSEDSGDSDESDCSMPDITKDEEMPELAPESPTRKRQNSDEDIDPDEPSKKAKLDTLDLPVGAEGEEDKPDTAETSFSSTVSESCASAPNSSCGEELNSSGERFNVGEITSEMDNSGPRCKDQNANSTMQGNTSASDLDTSDQIPDRRNSASMDVNPKHGHKDLGVVTKDSYSDVECLDQSSDAEQLHTSSSDAEHSVKESSAPNDREAQGGAKMYQCHDCMFITTSLSNIQEHVKEAHDSSDAGFMEIDTGFDQEGNIITSVNG